VTVKARYTVKPGADRDLDEYGDHLAREASVDMGLRFFDAARQTFALLGTRQNMGWLSRVNYPGLEGLRVFRVGGFEQMLVCYRPPSKGVEILRVVHGSRNLLALPRREGLE
jgi:toxin ParE1/3/4